MVTESYGFGLKKKVFAIKFDIFAFMDKPKCQTLPVIQRIRSWIHTHYLK